MKTGRRVLVPRTFYQAVRESRAGLWELYGPDAGNKVVCLLVQNLKQ